MGELLMVSSNVVFAFVVSQVLLTWVPPDIIHILCNFITNPKIYHFHQMRSLSFDSVICNTNGSHVITMNLFFGLRMPRFFKGHGKTIPSFQLRKRAPNLALAADSTTNRRMVQKVKNAPFNLIGLPSSADHPMKKWPHARLRALALDKYKALECMFIIMPDAQNQMVALGFIAR
jgi:hypothetical protein